MNIVNLNFNRISSKRSDVLIIDKSGSEYISKCIPSNLSINILNVREGIPYIPKLSFLVFLLRRIFKFKLTYRALITAIVDEIDPRVIISFIDTDIVMGQLDLTFPEKLVISVQNGSRMHMGGTNNNYFLLPHYFAFGEYEKDLIKKLNVKYKTFHSVGSLKLGLFLKKCTDTTNNGICFISDYESPKNQFNIERVSRHRQVFSNLIAWNNVNIHQIKVAMRSNRTNEIFYDETKFFNDIGHAELIERTEFSSYQTGYDSSIIISTLSTLGYELFCTGKKVLFCGMTASNDNFTEKQGIDYIMHKLPDIVLLNSLSQLELNDKITSLINMSHEEYLSYTKDAQSYYMTHNNMYPHEAISKYIKNFMKKSTSNSNV